MLTLVFVIECDFALVYAFWCYEPLLGSTNHEITILRNVITLPLLNYVNVNLCFFLQQHHTQETEQIMKEKNTMKRVFWETLSAGFFYSTHKKTL